MAHALPTPRIAPYHRCCARSVPACMFSTCPQPKKGSRLQEKYFSEEKTEAWPWNSDLAKMTHLGHHVSNRARSETIHLGQSSPIFCHNTHQKPVFTLISSLYRYLDTFTYMYPRASV